MIQSYKEEVTSRRNKAAIFWLIVFVFSCFLYLFFQGYYLNIDFKDIQNKKDPRASDILKQFWIVKMQIFPNPEQIYIWKKQYNNWDKKIMDYWYYNVEVYSSWYIPINFNIQINKEYPIFYETINQFKKFRYHGIPLVFDDISKLDDNYLVFSKKDKSIEVLNQKFKLINTFESNYLYIGYKYFSDNWYIYAYDNETNLLKPFISKETKLTIFCKSPKIYHNRLFCYDNMDFIDWSKMKWEEKVVKINDNLILTDNFIYNNWNWWDWGTYEHANKFIYDPENLVHINKMPYILENGLLYQIEKTKKTQFILPDIDIIKTSFEFWNELILIWYKWQESVFLLIDEKKMYSGKFNNIDPKKISVKKQNWVYLFNTWENIYVYYKWSQKLLSTLKWINIKIIDDIAFFIKDSKNYYVNFNEE